jgi:hypothetical protein
MTPTEYSAWDTIRGMQLAPDEVMGFIAAAPTCVFIRLRKDGHPVGAVVGHRVIDGEIYTSTNTFRAAHAAILRDPRCTVVFDNPGLGVVTVIGRGEIVDDPAFIKESYEHRSPNHWLVTSGRMSAKDYVAMGATPNRRMIHVHPEKFLTHDLRKLEGAKWPPEPAAGLVP